MSRTAVVALVFVAASASVASAGPYVGLGVGTGAASSGDFDLDENGRSARLMLGYRFGRISVEGMGSRYRLGSPDAWGWDASTLALAGKFSFPLGDQFEAFPRLGVQRTSVSRDDNVVELAGNGFLIGGGFEYRIPGILAGASVFVDYSILRTALEHGGNNPDSGLTSRIWTLGATLSF